MAETINGLQKAELFVAVRLATGTAELATRRQWLGPTFIRSWSPSAYTARRR